MSTEKKLNLVEIAKKLAPRLPPQDQQTIQALLSRSEQGDPAAEFDLSDALTQREVVRLWLREQEYLLARGLDALPGNISILPASQKWSCPQDPAETLPVIREGEDAPICAVHQVAMRRGK